MRFYLVDRITGWEPHRWITGVKGISRAEACLTNGPDSEAELPGLLVVEALAQLGAWLLLASTDFTRRPVLLGFGAAEFPHPVRPGDRLTLHGHVESGHEDSALLAAEARVGDLIAVQVRDLLCAIGPAGDLEDPAETRRLFRTLTRAA